MAIYRHSSDLPDEAHGAVVARSLGPRGSVPPYVCIPQMHKSAGASYLGATSAPLTIQADPNAPDFAVPDIVAPLAFDSQRLSARQELLRTVDRYQRSAELKANRIGHTAGVFKQKAFDLMTSADAKRAFNIHAESDKLRDQYGRTTLGQSIGAVREGTNAEPQIAANVS